MSRRVQLKNNNVTVRTRNGLGNIVLFLIVIVGALAGWAYLRDFVDGVQEVEKKDISLAPAGDMAGELFHELTALELIKFDGKSARLNVLVDCLAMRDGVMPSVSARVDEDRVKVAARRYCLADPGRTIQNEVESWNESLSVVAVRDDRASGEPCVQERPTAVIALKAPVGCHPNRWTSSILTASGEEVFVASRSNMPPPAAVFGFLTRSLSTEFGDWLRLRTDSFGDRVLVFRSTLTGTTGSDGRVTIDVIGELEDVLFNGISQRVTPAIPAAPPAATPADMPVNFGPNVSILCATSTSSNACHRIASTSGPKAFRVVVDLPRGKTIAVVLKVRSRPAVPRNFQFTLEPLTRSMPYGHTVPVNFDRLNGMTTHVALACNKRSDARGPTEDEDGVVSPSDTRSALGDAPGGKEFVCGLVWRPGKPSTSARQFQAPTRNGPDGAPATPTPARPVPPMPVLIARADPGKTAERIELTPTKAAEYGLTPIVGLEREDAFAFASGGGGQVELTVDPELQKSADIQMRALLARSTASGVRGVEAALPPRFDSVRRAALVVVDAGPAMGAPDAQTGRILAVAGQAPFKSPSQVAEGPQQQVRVSAWDVEADTLFRPTASRLAPTAWNATDGFIVPGSTFKTVVALAAIDVAARGGADNPVRRMLEGLNADGMRDVLGPRFTFSYTAEKLSVPKGDDGADVAVINNAGGDGDVGPSVCSAALELPVCPRAGGKPIGLVEALARSSNLWFGRLALLMDEANVAIPVGLNQVLREDRSERSISDALGGLALGRMTERLWSRSNRSLGMVNGRPLEGRLMASNYVLEATNPQAARRLALAQNGIGQAVQATPLAMAAAAASIASGYVIAPYIAGSRPDPRPPLFGADPDLDARLGPLDPTVANQLLALLREGMRQVVNNPRGTAHGAFKGRGFASRVRGKTGTAEVSERREVPNTVWFIGWLDQPNIKGFEGRRLAFSCMVTHAARGSSGGEVCAPTIARLLSRFEGEALETTPTVPNQGGRRR